MNPQSFGKYQLIKKLATGGMAEVWLARQTGIEGFAKNVVVKRILPHLAEDHEFVEMFRNEALIAARFNHPNIAQVYEFGEANGAYFIAMEYIHGEDLGRVMRKAYNAGQWLARPLAIRIVASACEGLYYAHTRTDEAGRPLRVVHRDISPQNILISFDGSVKLVDFGIAKAADQASLTKSGAIKGKFAYMAPEQAAGKVLDARADIFAIGLVLYELLTGVRPLKRESELGTLQAALECAIPPPSEVADVPPELDSVVMTALAKAADDRYRDARQFQLALEEFLVGQRWVATSVQVSELMEALFADRLEEERRSGGPAPAGEDSLPAATPQPVEPPPPSRGESRARTSSEEHTSADMSWEAPPGEMVPQRGRTSVRPAPRSRSDSGTQTLAAPVEEEEEWEAPPSTEVGGRRRLTGARTSSRPEEARGGGGEPITGRRTGDAPAIRRSGMRMTPGADVEAPAPRPSRGGALALNARARPLEVEDDDDERTQLPEPEPPRRRTGQASSPQAGSPRQRASRAELSQAPARRRTSVEKENKDEPRPPVKGSKAPLPVKQLLGVVTALLLVGVVVVFHEPIWNMLNSSAIDGQALQINLESNEPVRISVRHGERCGGQGVSVLSDQTTTRLKGVGGVHVQDTLILENKQRGIFRELPIDYGEPNNTRSFRVEFKRGFIQLKLVPGRSLSGVEIYRDDQLIGRYPSAPIELMEGTHQLELRSQQSLKEPVPFEVQITAGQTTSRTVDVSRYLR